MSSEPQHHHARGNGANTGRITVIDLFKDCVRQDPNGTAIVFQNRDVSYIELDVLAERVQRVLRRNGAKQHHKIAVLTNRCPQMVACFLAVLRIGASYIPMDLESWNEDKIEDTLDILSPDIVLATEHVELKDRKAVSVSDGECHHEATGSALSTPGPATTNSARIESSDPAYIIFTSGTTSVPKGVMVSHGSLANYVQVGGRFTPFNMDVQPGDTILLTFSIAFDACTGAIFSTLCNGGTLVISQTSDLVESAMLCNKIPATPSLLISFGNPADFPRLREIFVGGESPSPQLIERWTTSSCRIWNCYGPTETTCASTISELFPEYPITLGETMPGSKLILLNEDLEETSEGEICISGPGLAIGYYQNANLTKEKFIQWRGQRIYRTGDFARKTDYGTEFLGRQDTLVKNRGFLINLETQVIPALQAIPEIQSTAAVMHLGQLIAFVTPSTVDPKGIRNRLASSLSKFLIPDHIEVVDRMPLTSNGKMDVRALTKSFDERLGPYPSLNTKSVSKLQMLKASIATLLSVPLSRISEHESFWDLGGNSLTAITLLSFLRSQGLTIQFSQLLQSPNLIAINAALLPCRGGARSQIPVVQPVGSHHTRHGGLTTCPMTKLQSQMARSLLHDPLSNYLLISSTFDHGNAEFPMELLKKAWLTVMRRHTIFRTGFNLLENSQEIHAEFVFNWTAVQTDFDNWDSCTRMEIANLYHHVRKGQHQKDNMRIVPIAAFRLVTIPRHRSRLFWLVHHCHIDGWSAGVILREVQVALTGGRLKTAPQFAEMVPVQEAHKKVLEVEAEAFWMNVLRDFLPPVPLSLAKPSVTQQTDDRPETTIMLSVNVAEISQKARAMDISSATVAYAAWALLLSRHCSSDQVLFGAVFSGRNLESISADAVVGPMLNTCPLPVQVPSEITKTAFLSRLFQRLVSMQDYQWSALDYVEDLAHGSHEDLLTSIVTIEWDLPNLYWHCENLTGTCTFDRKENSDTGISVILGNENGEAYIRIQYDPSRYTDSAMNRMATHFDNILKALLDTSCVRVEDVLARMIDSQEMTSILGANLAKSGPYVGPLSLKESLEVAMKRWSSLAALEYLDQSITYGQIDAVTSEVARCIAKMIVPGDVVGILSDGSPGWIIRILAVVRAGGVCAPIDHKLPTQRIQVILQEIQARLCVAPSRAHLRAISLGTTEGLAIDEVIANVRNSQYTPLPTSQYGTDTAYIVFTSGSTGKPKGVRVSHIGILSLLTHPPARLHAEPGRKIAQFFSVGFDGCCAEIFGSLTYGATLLLKDPQDPFSHLEKADAVMATPSLLATLPVEKFANLETVVFLGESVPQGLADLWSHGRRLYNSYGPCECAFLSTIVHLTPGKQVTIGSAVPRMCVRLLDSEGRPTPKGIIGEICLSGVQVSPGYLGLEGVVDDRFTRDPFEPGTRMYRTGDLGYWTESREVQFVGRKDDQVKVRGFRVELEEVQQALLAGNSHIQHAGVVLKDDCLYGSFSPSEDVDVDALSKHLSTVLPHYAQPSRLIALRSLPLNPNQKIDRKALEKYPVSRTRKGGLPKTPTEILIAGIWSELIPSTLYEDIGVEDDFMFLGGNSLLQIRFLQQLMSELRAKIPLGVIIRKTKLQELASTIDTYIASTQDTIAAKVNSQHASDGVLSYVEAEMYQLYQAAEVKSAYHMVLNLSLSGKVQSSLLADAFDAVITQNEMLRAQYIQRNGTIFRQIAPSAVSTRLLLAEHDMAEHEIAAVLKSEMNEVFDLASEQPIRSVLIQTNPRNYVLSVVVHHIVGDKQTLHAILQQVRFEYERALGTTTDGSKRLPKNGLAYADWAKINTHDFHGDIDLTRLDFWRNHLKDATRLPLSTNCHETSKNQGASRRTSLGTMVYSRKSQLMAVAAVFLTVQEVFQVQDLVIGMPYMNRDHMGAWTSIGLFLDRFVVRLQSSSLDTSSINSFLDDVDSRIQDSLASYMPYRQLCSTFETDDLFDVMVTYHWRDDALDKPFQLPGVTTSPLRARPEGAKFPLLFEFTETEGDLACDIEYNTTVLSEDEVDLIETALAAMMRGFHERRPPRSLTS